MVNNLFKKFFGKKNDGFYVQLEDEDAKSTPAPKALTTAAPASESAPTVTVPTKAAAPAAKADNKTAKTEKKTAKKAETPKVVIAPVPVAAPPAPVITNFATDYLIKPSSISDRRRPGANMSQFMDLARQIDKSKPFKATAVERKADAEKSAAKPPEKSQSK